MIKKILNSFLKVIIKDAVVTKLYSSATDKVVVVTGGSKGVGYEVGKFLAEEGYVLVLISRNINKKILSNFKNPQKHLTINADITKEEDVNAAFLEIEKKFTKIDVLINNAGIFLDKPIDDVLMPEFYSIIETNFKGLFLLTSRVVPLMKRQKEGLIINIGSKISHNTNVGPNKVLYATTKYTTEGFSISLSKELKKFGIRVTCLMPGTINTFISLKSKNFLPPDSIGHVISFIIKAKNIDFESLVFKSRFQDL